MQNKWILTATLLAMGVLAGRDAYSAGIAQRGAPDPLLGGPLDLAPKDGPCDAQLAGPRYAPGVDAYGRPVKASDLPHPPMPGPQMVMVQAGGALVEIDPQAVLERAPACPPPKQPRR